MLAGHAQYGRVGSNLKVPDTPCMAYLHPNVGKYAIHGVFGDGKNHEETERDGCDWPLRSPRAVPAPCLQVFAGRHGLVNGALLTNTGQLHLLLLASCS